MKTRKRIQIILLSVILVLVYACPGFSALSTQTTGEDEIDVDVTKTAPGTKLSGPLTIYYDPIGGGNAYMYVFLRLRKGYDLYAFSAKLGPVEYSTSGVDGMQFALEDWVAAEVIPQLYCPFPAVLIPPDEVTEPPTPPTCSSTGLVLPTFAIKSVDQYKEDSVCYFCTDAFYFAIMDVVIAVQD